MVGMIAENFTSNDISFLDAEHISEPYASWCKTFLKERSPLSVQIFKQKNKAALQHSPLGNKKN